MCVRAAAASASEVGGLDVAPNTCRCEEVGIIDGLMKCVWQTKGERERKSKTSGHFFKAGGRSGTDGGVENV